LISRKQIFVIGFKVDQILSIKTMMIIVFLLLNNDEFLRFKNDFTTVDHLMCYDLVKGNANETDN